MKYHNIAAKIMKPRSTTTIISIALITSTIYILLIFTMDFLLGRGAFWDYPVGPWLHDSADAKTNVDILDYLVAYTGLVRSPWGFPLFHVAAIGAPVGTDVVFLDVIPIAALLGRIGSSLTGSFILPYGAWVGSCFVLSAIFAVLMLAEGGQRSILGAIAASIFAVSAPTLLHRFGHLPLLAHFLIIGSLFLYMRERHERSKIATLFCWVIWLSLSLFTNPYLFGMVAAIYFSSLARYWRLYGVRSRWIEPILVCFVLMAVLFMLGFIGSGAQLSGGQFGYFSMNVLSPFIPQRSGIFPSMTAIFDGTGGQYEGFNYLGLGALVLIVVAILIDPAGLRKVIRANPELVIVLCVLTIFAISSNIWIGDYEFVKINIGWKLRQVTGIYRSSGRMFWPAYYILMFGSLIFVLSKTRSSLSIPLIFLCILLQLLDTEPLRARVKSLADHGGTPLLSRVEWSQRISRSDFVNIFPPYSCSDDRGKIVDMEIQLIAVSVGRSFNVSYNPRLQPDCIEEVRRAVMGPWSPTTLYVFLGNPLEVDKTWTPAQLACQVFSDGKWCLGRDN